jgi:hypothetical protein
MMNHGSLFSCLDFGGSEFEALTLNGSPSNIHAIPGTAAWCNSTANSGTAWLTHSFVVSVVRYFLKRVTWIMLHIRTS